MTALRTKRVMWCETCDQRTRPDPESLPDVDADGPTVPVCGACGEGYPCGECGFEVDSNGDCLRADATGDDSCPGNDHPSG